MSVLSFLQRFRFTYRSNAVQSFGRNIQEFTKMFTPLMRAGIVTVAKPVVYCNPGVMVVTPKMKGFCQLHNSED